MLIKPLLLTALLTTVSLSLAVPASAADANPNLRKELKILAKGFAEYLQSEGEDGVVMGNFTSPPQLQSSGGLSIAQILGEELKAEGVELKKRSRMAIQGNFRDVTDSDSKQLAIQITGEVVTRQGEVKLSLSRGVFGEVELTSILGTTVSLDPKDSAEERNKAIEESLDNSTTNIKGGSRFFDEKGQYGIEILVKQGDQYVPREGFDEEGLGFVKLNKGEIYAVRLLNNTQNEAGVVLSIDGISMFAFSENKEYSHIIVDGIGEEGQPGFGDIAGWHINNKESDLFEVGELSEAAFQEINPGDSSNVGMITAVFTVAFPADAPPPDEPLTRSGEATKRGPRANIDYTEVQRLFGVVRATVSVRYSRPN